MKCSLPAVSRNKNKLYYSLLVSVLGREWIKKVVEIQGCAEIEKTKRNRMGEEEGSIWLAIKKKCGNLISIRVLFMLY